MRLRVRRGFGVKTIRYGSGFLRYLKTHADSVDFLAGKIESPDTATCQGRRGGDSNWRDGSTGVSSFISDLGL